MKQKTTYVRYLLIGISALTVLLSSCRKQTEYRMKMDLLFINQTNKEISFIIRPDILSSRVENIIIGPQSQSRIFTFEISGVDKIPNIETCCRDALIGAYGGSGTEGYSQMLRINDSLCVTHLNEKSVILSNYLMEKIADRHFRYSYTFTEADIANPKPCE